jgi:hypothetical protein
MSFTGVTKNVDKIQKSITYWLSTILIWFFHFWKVDYDSFRYVDPFIYYFNEFYFIYFLVLKEYMKNYHYDIHIRSP